MSNGLILGNSFKEENYRPNRTTDNNCEIKSVYYVDLLEMYVFLRSKPSFLANKKSKQSVVSARVPCVKATVFPSVRSIFVALAR